VQALTIAPPLPFAGVGGQAGAGLAVDQDEVAFAAHHLGHRRHRLDVAAAVEGDVGDDQDPFAGDRYRGALADGDGAVESPPKTWSATIPWWCGWYQCTPGGWSSGSR